jgi:hypothetical protein
VSRFSVVYIRTSLQTIDHLHNVVRDRPFNLQGGRLWFFVSIRIFFPDNTRVRILIFFQNSTLGYMTKTLNQIIFFFLHQNQNIFFSNNGNQNIFLEKPKPKPLQAKWSFPNDINYSFCRKKTSFSAYDEFMLITQN